MMRPSDSPDERERWTLLSLDCKNSKGLFEGVLIATFERGLHLSGDVKHYCSLGRISIGH